MNELLENINKMEYEIDDKQIQSELFHKQVIKDCDNLDKAILLELYFNSQL